jgi:Amt family ammonium transporter
MFMQAGFADLESGMVRSKNSINVPAKNFADFLVTATVFWLLGFGVMFGASAGGWVGTSQFAFNGGGDAWLLAFFVFQMGFAETAATIVSGAVAERARFGSYLLITLIVGALINPVFGHWAWGGVSGLGGQGWLERLGFIDFAGSTVVHSIGGWTALVAVVLIGPRLARFGDDAVRIHGHDLPVVTVGVFILWVGWFGFNGGSLLALTEDVPQVIVNTVVSGAFGGIAALALTWWRDPRPDIGTMMNGALAGLVGITASANITTTTDAVLIGTIAGGVMFVVTVLLERFEVDDAVGAIPVHLPRVLHVLRHDDAVVTLSTIAAGGLEYCLAWFRAPYERQLEAGPQVIRDILESWKTGTSSRPACWRRPSCSTTGCRTASTPSRAGWTRCSATSSASTRSSPRCISAGTGTPIPWRSPAASAWPRRSVP